MLINKVVHSFVFTDKVNKVILDCNTEEFSHWIAFIFVSQIIITKSSRMSVRIGSSILQLVLVTIFISSSCLFLLSPYSFKISAQCSLWSSQVRPHCCESSELPRRITYDAQISYRSRRIIYDAQICTISWEASSFFNAWYSWSSMMPKIAFKPRTNRIAHITSWHMFYGPKLLFQFCLPLNISSLSSDFMINSGQVRFQLYRISSPHLQLSTDCSIFLLRCQLNHCATLLQM